MSDNRMKQGTRRAAGFAVLAAIGALGWRWNQGAPDAEPIEPEQRDQRVPQIGSLRSRLPAQAELAQQAAEIDALALSAKTILAVPPDPIHGEAPAPTEDRPLPPALEQERRLALASWKQRAASDLRRCFLEESLGRLDARQVELRVLFAPDVRHKDAPAQALRPQWVSATPEALRRLAERFSPRAVQICLDELRALTFEVQLASATTPAPTFPMSMERFTAAL